MKKIITAIGNESLNINLKKEINIQVLINDIQYKEGIIEILEENQDIDFVIFNDLLQGEISTTELVQKILNIIPKIKIIVFLENEDKELETYLYSKGVFKVIYNNQIEVEDLIKIINDEKESNEDLKEELQILKNIILENQQKKNKNIKRNNLKEIISNKIKNIKINKIKTKGTIKDKYNLENRKTKVFSITGPQGVGKSIISVNLAKVNIYSNNKILLIDLDNQNNSIHTILGVKKNPIKINSDFFKDIVKINKKIDLLIINNSNINNQIEKIKKLKSYYDLIIIDLSQNNSGELIKKIIDICDINVFVSDTNLLEINKSIKLLDIYINKYKINKNKFNILFNKYNSNSISVSLLNKILGEFYIIGFLKYDKKYNKLINKNSKYFLQNKKIRNEYLKINHLINKINKKIN